MNKKSRECPDCGRANPVGQKKCSFCDAVMQYGKDYYRFKNFLLLNATIGSLVAVFYVPLSKLNIVDISFIDNLPNWVSYIFWGYIVFCFICYFLFHLGDLDEAINE